MGDSRCLRLTGDTMSAKKIRTRHAGVYQRGSRYVYVYRDGNGKQRQGSARTLDEARKARNALMVKVNRGEEVSLSTETVAEYLRGWLDTCARDGSIRPNTREDYRAHVENRLIPKLGNIRLGRLRKANVKELIRWLHDDEAQGRHLSDSTVRAVVRTLSSALSAAAEDEKIAANPVIGIRLAKRDRAHAIQTGVDAPGEQVTEKARALTEEQAAALVAATPERHRPLVRLLDVTGLRISEALALRWGDLDLDGAARVYVNRMVAANPDRKPGDPWWLFQPPKSAAGQRSVPIPESLAIDLRHRQVEMVAAGTPAGDGDLVFATRDGNPLQQRNVRRVFRAAAAEAGAGWAGFHALRHTCASRLFAAGMNPKQIAKWLGHADAAFTMRTYVHLLADDAPVALAESGAAVDADTLLTPPRSGGPAKGKKPAVIEAGGRIRTGDPLFTRDQE
jgi:integrase